MQNNILTRFDLSFFWGISLTCIISLLAGIYFEQYLFFGIPVLIAFVYYAFTDFKKIYFLLLFCLPLSTEVMLGSFGTDLPTEPLIVALMFIFFIYYLLYPSSLPTKFFTNPIIILLGLHYLWIFFTMLHSINVVVSLKYFLAKTWYITVFVFLTSIILNNVQSVKYFFWIVFIPLSLVMIQTVARFSTYNFDFEFVNETMTPFFRNKVNYGAMLTSFYPFIWLATSWYKRWSITGIILKIAILIYPIAIYLSFTRMCYVALVVAAIAYFIIRLRAIKIGVVATVLLVSFSMGYFIHKNTYLRLAPDYEKTISHDNFEDLIAATIQGQDVSSMERVYRWIAAFRMSADRPVMGFGPNNFYPHYMRYAVSSFSTYISDNEEKSTVHNYFILLLVEQGIVGLVIFLIFNGVVLIKGEKIYHRLKLSENKNIVMACLLSLITAYVNLFFNDMIEVDKTGSLFFMSIAMIVAFGMKEEQPSVKPAT